MDLKRFNEFSVARESIKETSKDDSKGKSADNVYFLSNDLRQIISFDHVKRNYLNNLGLSEEYAESVDGLFQTSDKDVCFVEFKNGEFNNTEISKKVKDSLLIFTDITDSTIEFTRENAIFMLVVNDAKINRLNPQDKRALALAIKGNQDFAIYGLNRLRGYCFKKIMVYPASNFEKWVGKQKLL